MKIRLLTLILAVLSLTGCTSLLEREYSVAEPHSSKFWESGSTATLRAENRQDIVNDLLLLIGQHTETAAIRLYNFEDDLMVSDALEGALVEVQQETAMGAYAVEFITTSTSHKQRGYYEIEVQISYRRTAEQIQSVTNATSSDAIYSLLQAALDGEKTELAVRMGYWGPDGKSQVETAVAQLREEQGLTDADRPWLVYYYPAEGPVGLLEFVLDPTKEQIAEMLPPEEDDAGTGENYGEGTENSGTTGGTDGTDTEGGESQGETAEKPDDGGSEDTKDPAEKKM